MSQKKTIDYKAVREMAEAGATAAQLCDRLGISSATLYNRMKADPELRAAWTGVRPAEPEPERAPVSDEEIRVAIVDAIAAGYGTTVQIRNAVFNKLGVSTERILKTLDDLIEGKQIDAVDGETFTAHFRAGQVPEGRLFLRGDGKVGVVTAAPDVTDELVWTEIAGTDEDEEAVSYPRYEPASDAPAPAIAAEPAPLGTFEHLPFDDGLVYSLSCLGGGHIEIQLRNVNPFVLTDDEFDVLAALREIVQNRMEVIR